MQQMSLRLIDVTVEAYDKNNAILGLKYPKHMWFIFENIMTVDAHQISFHRLIDITVKAYDSKNTPRRSSFQKHAIEFWKQNHW